MHELIGWTVVIGFLPACFCVGYFGARWVLRKVFQFRRAAR
jgi:hypothetical protein